MLPAVANTQLYFPWLVSSNVTKARFLVLEDETGGEEDEILTPATEEFITAASHNGLSIEELLQAEAELQEVGKVSHPSPDSADFCCPRASKIIRAITRDKSLKHQVKPWKGPLPEQRVSPPQTLGHAVIKNSCIKLKGGRMMPKSCLRCHCLND
jgi:hypothetical protein